MNNRSTLLRLALVWCVLLVLMFSVAVCAIRTYGADYMLPGVGTTRDHKLGWCAPTAAVRFAILWRPAYAPNTPWQSYINLTYASAHCTTPMGRGAPDCSPCTTPGIVPRDRLHRILYGKLRAGGVDWFAAESEMNPILCQGTTVGDKDCAARAVSKP